MMTKMGMNEVLLARTFTVCETCPHSQVADEARGMERACILDGNYCGPWAGSQTVPDKCPRQMETAVFNDHRNSFIAKHGYAEWVKQRAWTLAWAKRHALGGNTDQADEKCVQ
jgi:hypothetical protein